MTNNDILEMAALLELARSLNPMERRIIQALHDKGSGLPIEVAVRVLSLPDEVKQPLESLQAKKLIRAEPFSGGQFGSEVLSLTDRGERVAEVLGQPSKMAAQAMESVSRDTATKPALGEAEVLKSLGDLAARQGNADEARSMYERALDIYRALNAGSY